MLTILSPSKTQNFSDDQPKAVQQLSSEPALLAASEVLVKELKKKSINDIAQLMDVSQNIATLTYNRYRDFSTPFTIRNAKQALLAFKGDVYTDIAVDQYTKEDFEFAQQHLCILSGLYGLLKPMDLIQPYRLEMKTPLKNPKGKDLYQFWGDQITDQLNRWLEGQSQKIVINLASNEYFRVLNVKKMQGEIITPVFKEETGGTYKTIAIHAKRARGMMANYIIRHRIDDPESIKGFAEAGYLYSESHSKDNEWTFIRG